MMTSSPSGILLVDKPKGKTSFSLVFLLRKRLKVQKIGHAGTLDPFATGLMIMLIGKKYTRLQSQFLKQNKEYIGRVFLGTATDTYDSFGKPTHSSAKIVDLKEIEKALANFQGHCIQVPPMYSAKKWQGKKLYDLARKGIEIERKPCEVFLQTTLLRFEFPFLDIHVHCSSGTYVRSLAHDLGKQLGTYAHLVELKRTKSGHFDLSNSISVENIADNEFNIEENLCQI